MGRVSGDKPDRVPHLRCHQLRSEDLFTSIAVRIARKHLNFDDSAVGFNFRGDKIRPKFTVFLTS